MKKRIVSFLLATVMTCSFMYGCGGENSGDNETDKKEENTGKDGKVALKVWCAEEDEALMKQILSDFETKYKSEASFDFTLEFCAEADSRQNVLEDIENGPDVFSFADDQLRTFVAAGALAEVPNADDIKNRNLASAVETAEINGKLYGYPMTADNGYFLYYNKQYVSDEDAKSFDSILAAASANGKKMVMDWSSGWYIYSFFGQTGLTMGLNDDGVSNYCTWNSTENSIKGVDVGNAMIAIATNPGFSVGNDDALKEGAINDTVVAGVSGVWLSTALKEAWGDNLGTAKLPTYTVNGSQVQMGSFSGFKMIGVNDYSSEKEWAHKLADFITNEQNQTLRFTMRGQGPSNINAAASSEVSGDPAIQALLAQSEYATPQRVGGQYWEPAQKLGQTFATGSLGDSDLQTFLDKIVETITISYSN